MPVISNLVYTVTESTIVATWNTDVAADSNLSAGGKAAIDNGFAANSTSHQAVVTGLLPNTLYSCVVTSGGTSSSPQNVTTNAAPTRILVKSATMGAVTNGTTPGGDTYRTFLSNDNNTYTTQDDGFGFVVGSPNSGFNTQVGVLTNEATFAGTLKSLSAYGGFNAFSGTDGPGGAAMVNKSNGLFGLNGNLHMFVYRQHPPAFDTWRYCNWIKSTDHGATWNNFTATSTFLANGNPVTPNSPAEPIQFYDLTIGLVLPVRYGADDGTLGYNTAGNQIDGGNAYVYCTFFKDATGHFMLRIPRIKFDAQTTTAFEYWVGPPPASATPAAFVNDANWSASPTSATDITPSGINPSNGITQTDFVPAINSYILTTVIPGSPGTIATFFAAPTPVGPWTQFFNQSFSATGSQWGFFNPMHRELVNNVATNNIPIRFIFNGEPGQANYKPNWATFTLSTTMPANTFVQGNKNTAGGGIANPYNLAFPGNVTLGNLLVAFVRHGPECAVSTVKGTLNTTNWTVVYDTSDGATSGSWAYTFSQFTGPETVVVTYTATPNVNGTVGAIGEWNGVNAVRATAAANVQSGVTSLVSNAVAALAGDLILGFFESNNGKATTTGGSGYTVREQGKGGDLNIYVTIEDNLSAAGGSTTATLTVPTTTGGYTSGIGAFFAQTFNITGNAGTPGATVSYTGASSGSVVADGSGNYTIPTNVNGAYTITPSKTGFTFSPTSQNVNMVSANVAGVNFVAIAPVTVYSQPDCRVSPFGPNSSRTVQGTKIYDVQTSSNSTIPPTDSRTQGAPVDSRVSPNIPQNSRAPGTYGPGVN